MWNFTPFKRSATLNGIVKEWLQIERDFSASKFGIVERSVMEAAESFPARAIPKPHLIENMRSGAFIDRDSVIRITRPATARLG